jgi:hypothetical protein
MLGRRRLQTVAMQGVILRLIAYLKAYKATVSLIQLKRALYIMIKQDYAQQEYQQEQYIKSTSEHWAMLGIVIVGCTFTMMVLLSI